MPAGNHHRIGFVLVSFNLPEQTIFLCRRLTEEFGDAPIALHHDFGQCDLDRSRLPANVHVVDPWMPTRWATMSVVDANLAALRLLYRVADPEWCVSLSTADYPIRTADHILSSLDRSPWDAYIDHREVIYRRLPGDYRRVEAAGFHDPGWPVIAYNRYVAVPLPARAPEWCARSLRTLMYLGGPRVESLFTPFTPRFRPYGGDAWYTLNRRAAHVLAAEDAQHAKLWKHYLHRAVPEESFYHTILCNAGLRICGDNLRYADWSGGGRHPRLLTRESIPAFAATNAHFARKLPFDPALFAEIDRAARALPAALPIKPPVGAAAGGDSGLQRSTNGLDLMDACHG